MQPTTSNDDESTAQPRDGSIEGSIPTSTRAPAEREPGEREPAERASDRRTVPTVRLSRWSLAGGQRRAPRRAEEVEGSFVDVYGHGLLLAVLWVALMNAADSFFTIIHLQNGGTEVNPIAEVLLQSGRSTFVCVKEAVISLALLVLCLHKNFYLARLGLWTAAVAYTGLLAYHLMLFLV